MTSAFRNSAALGCSVHQTHVAVPKHYLQVTAPSPCDCNMALANKTSRCAACSCCSGGRTWLCISLCISTVTQEQARNKKAEDTSAQQTFCLWSHIQKAFQDNQTHSPRPRAGGVRVSGLFKGATTPSLLSQKHQKESFPNQFLPLEPLITASISHHRV